MFHLKKWSFKRVIAFGASVFVSLQISSAFAAETVYGYTFDSCVRFPNGEINFCRRNGELWGLFGKEFINFMDASNNRWRMCVISSPTRAAVTSVLSSLVEVEVNCSARTIETLQIISYKGGFCEGPSNKTTNFKRGQVVNPVLSETDSFGFLEYLACNKKTHANKSLSAKKPTQNSQTKVEKKPVVINESQIQVEETYGPPEPPAFWYSDPPDYCKDFDTFIKDCESGDFEACYFAGLAYKPHAYSYNLHKGNKERKIEGEASYCPKVEASKHKALEYFNKACDGSDGWGCYELGKEKEANNNWRESLTNYEKGCKSKEPCGIACRKAAQFYISGNLVREDQKKASDLLERGCATKDATSCLNLAKLFEAEKAAWLKFIAKSRAKKYYGLACDYGDTDGCHNYKRMNSE